MADASQGKRVVASPTSDLTDKATLRARARQHVERGAITDGYQADRDAVIKILNEALATEIVCVLRYRRHFYTAQGLNAKSIAAEFMEHSTAELAHADLLAARIVQIGGDPDFNPDGMPARSHAEYIEGETLVDMIRENLVAERIAIDSYAQVVRYLGDRDPTTRRVVESILAEEEEHAEDLANMLQHLVGDDAQR